MALDATPVPPKKPTIAAVVRDMKDHYIRGVDSLRSERQALTAAVVIWSEENGFHWSHHSVQAAVRTETVNAKNIVVQPEYVDSIEKRLRKVSDQAAREWEADTTGDPTGELLYAAGWSARNLIDHQFRRACGLASPFTALRS